MKDSQQPDHFSMSPVVDKMLPTQQIDALLSDEDQFKDD
jgi:hypothetical protein